MIGYYKQIIHHLMLSWKWICWSETLINHLECNLRMLGCKLYHKKMQLNQKNDCPIRQHPIPLWYSSSISPVYVYDYTYNLRTGLYSSGNFFMGRNSNGANSVFFSFPHYPSTIVQWSGWTIDALNWIDFDWIVVNKKVDEMSYFACV